MLCSMVCESAVSCAIILYSAGGYRRHPCPLRRSHCLRWNKYRDKERLVQRNKNSCIINAYDN